MLTFTILFSVLILFFYLSNRYNKYAKETVMLISLFSMALIWSIYLFIDAQRISIYIEAGILLLLVVALFYINSINTTKDPIKIYAKQENYWDIDEGTIISAFKDNEIEKEDRVEINTTKEPLYIEEYNQNEDRFISPYTLSYFKKLDSIYETKEITNIKEISKYPTHNKIFQKISSLLEKDKELFIDYDSLLNQWKGNIDFFIINLWDEYSKDFNIGIGQLESICKNDPIEQELINTLDNVNLKMIKLKGSYLQYKYEQQKEKGGF